MIVACQWKRSSPTGPAEQFAGGSRPRSCVARGRECGVAGSGVVGALSRGRRPWRGGPGPAHVSAVVRRRGDGVPGPFFRSVVGNGPPRGPCQLRQAAARTACQPLVYVAPSPRQRLPARRRASRLRLGPIGLFARLYFCSMGRRRIKKAAAVVQTTPIGDLQLFVDSF